MIDVEVTRIRVGQHSTGIVGLKSALESVAAEFGDRPDEEIQKILVERLSRDNYIAASTRDMYARAFLREYKKFTGRPFEEERAAGIEIKVLGQGCPRCRQLTQDLMTLMAETGIKADLEHVTDIKSIAGYGALGSPALVINGKVVAVGSIPSKSKLKELLEQAASNKNASRS